MENIEKIEETDIIPDYSIFNALNLYSEDLGQQYIKTGFNPFGEGFVINEEYVTDALANNKNKREVIAPDFLEETESSVEKSFNLSLENATQLLEALNGKMSGNLSPNQKKALQKLILSLQLYIELINIYIKKLKKEKNKYMLYVNLLAINWQLSEELSKSFTIEFDLQNTLNKIESQQQTILKEETELKQQAQKIIEENLKTQQVEQVAKKQKTLEQHNVVKKPKQPAKQEIKPTYKGVEIER